jgi:heptosyltransferase-3
MTSPVPQSVLVVVTRRIGDVFLTGALIGSVRQAWPQALIDVLVFKGTEAILQLNPDVNTVITVPERASLRTNLAMLSRLWRRYDVALSTSPSDRPTLYAWAAGRQRIGVMTEGAKNAWKSWLLQAVVCFDDLNTHTVIQNLLLADAAGIPRVYQLKVQPSADDEATVARLFPQRGVLPYAVIHPFPKFRYKMWRNEAWGELARWLQGRGLTVVCSGGPDPAEVKYVADHVASVDPRIINFAGRLSFGELGALIRRAALYVGPDTVTTHLAAATGVPTVALFGPSNPVKWGPWPAGWQGLESPFVAVGTQFRNNVALVQGKGHCVPCRLEGCARAETSESACLQMLRVDDVTAAIETLWRHGGR